MMNITTELFCLIPRSQTFLQLYFKDVQIAFILFTISLKLQFLFCPRSRSQNCVFPRVCSIYSQNLMFKSEHTSEIPLKILISTIFHILQLFSINTIRQIILSEI
jgi:hypothetical protein